MGDVGILCMLAGWWWRKEVKRCLDTTKMSLMYEVEKSVRGRRRGREAGRPCMKADVRRVRRNHQV